RIVLMGALRSSLLELPEGVHGPLWCRVGRSLVGWALGAVKRLHRGPCRARWSPARLRSPPIADDGDETQDPPPRLAYVVSRYPAISHAFLREEVDALRSLGATVETFSMRRVGDEHLLTDADRRAFDTTYAIVPPHLGDLAAAYVRALFTRPRRFARALGIAVGMRRPGLRGALWQLFYLLEGVLLWDRCRRRGVRHLHAQ